MSNNAVRHLQRSNYVIGQLMAIIDGKTTFTPEEIANYMLQAEIVMGTNAEFQAQCIDNDIRSAVEVKNEG